MKGSAMSCSVTAMAAAMMLLRVSHAKKIESRVFRPTNGVKPKKIPIATPPAMAFGVSRIASSYSDCSLTHLRTFIGSEGSRNLQVARAQAACRTAQTEACCCGAWRPRRSLPFFHGQLAVELNHVRITHAFAAKNIKRRANGQINSALPRARDFLQVSQRSRAAGVGRRDGRPSRQPVDELEINTAAQPFR